MKKVKYQVPSIHRAINILEHLRKDPNLTMKQIGDALELANSTCFNILTTLESRGMITRDPQTSRYQLGHNLMLLGMSVYENIDIRQTALPYMQKLSDRFNSTSYLSILDYYSLTGTIIERSVGRNARFVVMLKVGEPVPLNASGTGKALMLALKESQLNTLINRIKSNKYTKNTLVNRKEILEEIRLIKKNGYAMTSAELEEHVSSIGAPIRNFTNQVIAAISVAGHIKTMNEIKDEVVYEVKKASQDISKELGYIL